MNTITPHTFRLLLLALLPLASHAAPTPYWPGYYPPSPYYYPSQPIAQAEQHSNDVTEAESPTPQQSDETTTITAEAEVDEEDTDQPELTDLPEPTGKSVESDNKEDTEALTGEIAAAIQQGNFAEAYYLWRPLAESGSAEAQYGIGWMYHNGYGLAIDDDEAVAWWQLASLQGHVDATFALGMLYGLGEGPVKRDMTLAVHYYQLAARAGHEDAKLLLRTLMIEGDEDALRLMQTLFAEQHEKDIASPVSVTSNKANVRSGPGTQHKVLTTLLKGHKLLPLKREGRWLLLAIEGKPYTGWIHDSLVDRELLVSP